MDRKFYIESGIIEDKLHTLQVLHERMGRYLKSLEDSFKDYEENPSSKKDDFMVRFLNTYEGTIERTEKEYKDIKWYWKAYQKLLAGEDLSDVERLRKLRR